MELNFKADTEEMPIPEGLTPTQAYLRIAKKYGRKFTFALESVFDPKSTPLAKKFSSLSIICCNPLLKIKTKGKLAYLDGEKAIVRKVSRALETEYKKMNNTYSLDGKDPLHFLKSVMSQISVESGKSRFSFGPIGYASYDLVRFFEKLPETLPDNLNIPDIYFVIHRNAILFDHNKNKIHFVTHLLKNEKSGLRDLLKTANNGKELYIDSKIDYTTVKSNTSEQEFLNMIEKAKNYVRIGDIFQVVISRRIDVATNRDPIAIYFDLRKINPSPYMFYLDYGDFQVLGASPEIQVRVEKGQIEMRPIAGTRGRGASEEEEKMIEQELLKDKKELAEHTMLVDLCRNDLGRISEFGSVHEPELFIVERYSHVQHIVSHVVGKLKKGYDSFDVFRATFPAGTVSGAPKVRAMEIIEQLETEKRGTYAGIVGYFDLKGNMDTCITIRSILVKNGKAHVQAGAGIVLDSNPKGEWIETKRKANACIKAITGKELEI